MPVSSISGNAVPLPLGGVGVAGRHEQARSNETIAAMAMAYLM
jgi:hypothetical protein